MALIAPIRRQLKSAWDWILDLDVLEWGLPIFLSLLAIGVVLIEHWHSQALMDLGHLALIIIFGIVGPIIIHQILRWMHGLMNAQKQTAAEVQALNLALERKVDERTATLEHRNRELDRLNRELRDLDQMKSDFVALVSHELRAPLTALNGGLELALQSSDSLPLRSRQVLEIMEQESRRLTDFVQGILDVSRLDAGKLDLTLGPVAVRPLVEQAAAIVLASGNRKVEWSITPDLPPIWADETYFEQTIRNLISNADKYSPKAQPIHLCAGMQGERVRISVKDHGPGIPADVRERVFDRFSRLHSQESAPSGWGLGLYLGRKLIEAQGGEIGFVSPIWNGNQAPAGSEFFVLMPVARIPEDDLE